VDDRATKTDDGNKDQDGECTMGTTMQLGKGEVGQTMARLGWYEQQEA
jgi:hypothetical protein